MLANTLDLYVLTLEEPNGYRQKEGDVELYAIFDPPF
jgi:hypothetical protein